MKGFVIAGHCHPRTMGFLVNILALALYLPVIFLGYGTEGDTYLVLRSGNDVLEKGIYLPSRNPGYLVHEIGSAVLSRLGGSVLSNLATLFMAMVTVNSFLFICDHYQIPNRFLLALIIVLHPLFWVHSTCTIDYLWALGFTLAGFAFLLRNRWGIAGLLMGLAIGSRLASFIAVGWIVGFLYLTVPECRKKLGMTMLITGFVSLLCYVLSFISSGRTLSFLTPGMGGAEFWSLKMRIGRFVYKNIYFWGLQTIPAFLAAAAVMVRKPPALVDQRWRSLVGLCIAMIISYQLLYFKFPLKMAYLLPTLPFWALLLGIGLSEKRAVLIGFLVALLSYNVVSINIASPNRRSLATDAHYGVWVEKGPLVRDISQRLAIRHCDSQECVEKMLRR